MPAPANQRRRRAGIGGRKPKRSRGRKIARRRDAERGGNAHRPMLICRGPPPVFQAIKRTMSMKTIIDDAE